MALFVPDPEGLPVEELIEQLALEIAARYAAAEDELIRELAIRARRDLELQGRLRTAPGGLGLTAAERRRQNRLLAELAAHRARALRELQFVAAGVVERLRQDDLARQVLGVAAREGESAAAARLGLAGITSSAFPGAPFVRAAGSTSTQAVAAVVLSLESRLEVLNQRLTRFPQDAYQRIMAMTSRTVRNAISTGLRCTFSRMKTRCTLEACSESPSSRSSGKKNTPWWAITQRMSAGRGRVACSGAKATTGSSMSGSDAMRFGLAWWRVCLCCHQP